MIIMAVGEKKKNNSFLHPFHPSNIYLCFEVFGEKRKET
jgi:hypothetical protein